MAPKPRSTSEGPKPPRWRSLGDNRESETIRGRLLPGLVLSVGVGEAGVAAPAVLDEGVVEEPGKDLESDVHTAGAPSHLLLLHHASADDQVVRGFHERGGDGLTGALALSVVGDAGRGVGGEIARRTRGPRLGEVVCPARRGRRRRSGRGEVVGGEVVDGSQAAKNVAGPQFAPQPSEPRRDPSRRRASGELPARPTRRDRAVHRQGPTRTVPPRYPPGQIAWRSIVNLPATASCPSTGRLCVDRNRTTDRMWWSGDLRRPGRRPDHSPPRGHDDPTR